MRWEVSPLCRYGLCPPPPVLLRSVFTLWRHQTVSDQPGLKLTVISQWVCYQPVLTKSVFSHDCQGLLLTSTARVCDQPVLPGFVMSQYCQICDMIVLPDSMLSHDWECLWSPSTAKVCDQPISEHLLHSQVSQTVGLAVTKDLLEPSLGAYFQIPVQIDSKWHKANAGQSFQGGRYSTHF